MDKVIYIHIGIGKTGTTAIQDFLFQNSEKLDSFYYPSCGLRGTGHHKLTALQAIDMNTVEKMYKSLREEINRCKNDKIIISSELYSFSSQETIRLLYQALSSFTPKIVFYVRPQARLLESAYLQRIKIGENYSGGIENFFNYHKSSFNFINRIQPWVEIFGREAIIARLYDKRIFDVDICKDFLDAVEIKNVTLKSLSSHSNVSLIPEFASVMELIDNFLEDTSVRKKLINILLEHSKILRPCSSKSLIADELNGRILNYYFESNIEFANTFLNGLHHTYFLESIGCNCLTDTT
jgi:hypothetical protein